MPTEADRTAILRSKENSEMRDNIEEGGDVLTAMEVFCIYIKRLEIKNGDDTLILTDREKTLVVQLYLW